ncbi:response regulator, partial [Acinetobacter baumannii]
EFLLYLPVTAETLPDRAVPIATDLPGGAETILLVDDEPALLGTAARQLELLGYRVIPAPGGAEALALLDAGLAIDLLISDITMPPPVDGIA